MSKEVKLPHYKITGTLLKDGTYTDMHGKSIVIDLSQQEFHVAKKVPLLAEHYGDQIGYLTKIWKSGDTVFFEGYGFETDTIDDYMSINPGISAELTETATGFMIERAVVTFIPAIESAKIQEIVALSGKNKVIFDEIKAKHPDMKDTEIVDIIKNFKIQKINGDSMTEEKVIDVKQITESFKLSHDVISAKLKETESALIDAKAEVKLKDAKIVELEGQITTKVAESKQDLEVKLSQSTESIKGLESTIADLKSQLTTKETELSEMQGKFQAIEDAKELEAVTAEVLAIEPEFNGAFLSGKDSKAQIEFMKSYIELSKAKEAKKDPNDGKPEFKLSAPKDKLDAKTKEELEWEKAFGF